MTVQTRFDELLRQAFQAGYDHGFDDGPTFAEWRASITESPTEEPTRIVDADNDVWVPHPDHPGYWILEIRARSPFGIDNNAGLDRDELERQWGPCVAVLS